MTQTTVQKMTGDALIAHTEKCMSNGMTRTDLIIQAGYVRDDGRVQYTAFYEALLDAKRANNPKLYDPPAESETETYESLSEESKELYDRLSETIGEKWTHSEQLDFMDLMAEDLGIDTLSGFQDAFYSYSEEYNPEADFAEEYVNETENISSDSIYYHAIDWQSVWDHQLRYDFNTLEFDGCTYFFRNI
jgi:hypothetical protein